jgi:hypothetical protein
MFTCTAYILSYKTFTLPQDVADNGEGMLAKLPKEACSDQDIWIPVRDWETDCTYNAWLSVVLLKKRSAFAV